ncbi:MAG: hypothetical protein JXA24_00685 [Proteobacteria bacterium]|nr:hypothetical protein [Pseudomonadota bacterium]
MAYAYGGGTIALSMLSLVAGMFLLMKACGEEVCCRSFHKVVAYAVIVISMILIVCGGFARLTMCVRHGWGHCLGMSHRGDMMMEGMRPGMMPMMPMMPRMQPPPLEKAE